jgi:hypothetical protein
MDFTRLAIAFEPRVYGTIVKRDPDAPHRLYVTVLSEEALRPVTLDGLERTLSHRVAIGTVLQVCEPLRLPIEIVAVVRQGIEPTPDAPSATLVDLLYTALCEYFDSLPRGDSEATDWWRASRHDLFVRDALDRALSDERGASRLGSSGRLLNLASWRFELRLPREAGDLEAQASLCDASMVVLPRLEKILFR